MKLIARLPFSDLPKRLLFLDLETRGGIADFSKIELLVGGIVEYQRITKYQVVPSKFEYWEGGQVNELRDRLLEFDGLIVGMNLLGYDYRVLSRYFDVTPLLSKTLDFQHSLWRIGGTAVALGYLAKHNTRRKKVAGTDMAKFWDKGDKSYVLKRNRVDCELTAALYFQFLETGKLFGHRGCITISETDFENLLVIAGVMSQFSADEYAWRLEHHNGVRGDTQFLGIPWIARPDYESHKKAIYFRAKCLECNRDTLICTPNDETTNQWLASLSCGNCGHKYASPTKGRVVTAVDKEFLALLAEHNENERYKRAWGSRYLNPTLPTRFEISDNGGSFEIIANGYHYQTVPFNVEDRQAYETCEAELRGELKRNARPHTTVGARWEQWHPDLAYWQDKHLKRENNVTGER